MATRKSAKGRTKKVAKKAERKVAKKGAKKKGARKSASRTSARPGRATPAAKPAASKVRQGVITHSELASADPEATRAWCQKALGWKFGPAMPTPAGPYHMWQFENGTGGGIRANNPPEVPGTIPYCEVANIKQSFARAIAAGATGMLDPQPLPGGMGWIAIVSAPGGVAIGFWSMK